MLFRSTSSMRFVVNGSRSVGITLSISNSRYAWSLSIHRSTPFHAIITPLSVHSCFGGRNVLYPNSVAISLNARKIKSLQATPPENTNDRGFVFAPNPKKPFRSQYWIARCVFRRMCFVQALRNPAQKSSWCGISWPGAIWALFCKSWTVVIAIDFKPEKLNWQFRPSTIGDGNVNRSTFVALYASNSMARPPLLSAYSGKFVSPITRATLSKHSPGDPSWLSPNKLKSFTLFTIANKQWPPLANKHKNGKFNSDWCCKRAISACASMWWIGTNGFLYFRAKCFAYRTPTTKLINKPGRDATAIASTSFTVKLALDRDSATTDSMCLRWNSCAIGGFTPPHLKWKRCVFNKKNLKK